MAEDERRLKGEVKEMDRRGPALSDRTASNLRAAEEDVTFTHKRAPEPPRLTVHMLTRRRHRNGSRLQWMLGRQVM